MFSYNPDPHFIMESRSFSSNLDFSSSSFFPFSPAINQDGTLHDLLPQFSIGKTHSPVVAPTAPPLIKEVEPAPKKSSAAIGRKRATRKDQHSKIVTAQGLRDRRMRLNLEVAPQFFDIQDMLGYDKASKTVQWLMKEAKDSIEKLKAATRPKEHSLSGGGSSKSTEASTSELECEDISVSDFKGKSMVSLQEKITPKVKRVGRCPTRRTAYPSSLARKSRAMARARARERTSVKKLGDCCGKLNELLSSPVPFEAIGEESGSHDLKSSLVIVAEVEEQFSPSTKSKQLNNAGRVNGFSIGIVDYNNTVCPSDTTNMFHAEPWVNHFWSIEDDQMQTRLW